MAKKQLPDKTETVVNAIVNLRDHGEDCGCTTCQQDNQTVADNPKVVATVVKLVK